MNPPSLLIILLLLISSPAFAQDADKSCTTIQSLLEDKMYREALREMVLMKGSECDNTLRAEVLKYNGRYREALDLLKGGTSAEEEVLREELERILGIGGDKNTYAVYPENAIPDSIGSQMIFFVEKGGVFPLVKKEFKRDVFPYKEEKYQRYRIDSSLADYGAIDPRITGKWESHDVDLGPGMYCGDSAFYFTARYYSPPLSGRRNRELSVYYIDQNGKLKVPTWIDGENTFAHPYIDGNWLFFSSDKPGGFGGMDLYKINLSARESEPINLGAEVNSRHSEIFPCAVGDTLYFVSDDPSRCIGGYDILMHTAGKTTNPGNPLNGEYDDFNPYAHSSDLTYMVSNRRGINEGDRIYRVKAFKTRKLFDVLNGRVETSSAVGGKKVELLNDEGAVVDYTYVDRFGGFTFAHVKGDEDYTVRFPETDLAQGDRLMLFDDEYNVLEEMTSDGSDEFRFVLLTPEDYALKKVANEDESVLSVDISGMFSQSESERGGVEIIMEDAEGEVIAKAYTRADGSFTFEKVKPDDYYSFSANVVDPSAEIRIFNDKGEVIETISPNASGEYIYVRLKETDRVITITNEQNVVIKVEEDEKFNLPAIYFETDQARLNSESREILDRLYAILKENSHVSIDLAGHTDSRGGAEYNLQLSELRIESVKDYLIDKGIDAKRITGKGYGEIHPVNDCTDGVKCSEEEYAENRRTEIRFYNLEKP